MNGKMFYKALPGKAKSIFEKIIIKKERGEYFSKTIRKLYLEIYNIDVGVGSYGCFNVNQFPEGTRIGNYCSIAPRVYFLFSNHPMDTASTHPIFYNSILGYVSEDCIERVKLTVGNDVWIGAGTIITRGCTHIGNGVVIGAGSVVTHDIPAYAVVAGNPARIIRFRFSEDIQKALDSCKWFNLMPDELALFIDDINDPLVFSNKISIYRKEKKMKNEK